MTGPRDPEPAAAAAAELERLQELLRRAGRDRADPGEVARAVGAYWRDHGPALRNAAAALGDTARGQVLAELYRVRDELGRQLQGQRASAPRPPEPGTTEEPGRGAEPG
ncbi:hypothetical protein GCM10027261_00700 [Geodermatophilus arenarius]|uniref:Uncharacterized protein n=1 Tax=Geodermatophilus arenarius TaxID=1137990 RepID=A0ABV9LFF8_9ACTN